MTYGCFPQELGVETSRICSSSPRCVLHPRINFVQGRCEASWNLSAGKMSVAGKPSVASALRGASHGW